MKYVIDIFNNIKIIMNSSEVFLRPGLQVNVCFSDSHFYNTGNSAQASLSVLVFGVDHEQRSDVYDWCVASL